MPKLNSILKIVIIVLLIVVIPSFLSIFKISFDKYTESQKGEVEGVNVMRIYRVVQNEDGQESKDILVEIPIPSN